MTQQLDHPMIVSTPVAGTGTAVTPPVPTPGVAPPAGWSPPPVGIPPVGWSPVVPVGAPVPVLPGWHEAGGARGRTVALLVGGGVAGLLVVIVLIGALAGLFGHATTTSPAASPVPAPSVSAPAVPSAPSTVPATDPAATRAATQRSFDAAGVRLDHARTAFDQQLTAASGSGDLADFRAAAGTFRQELEVYRASVSGLAMPADQQASFSGTLVPALDATISDASDMEHASSTSSLKSAAHRFDEHWGLLVATHNRMDDALNAG